MKTLRKFYLALVAMMLCVGFTACEENGPNGPINADDIVGTWEVVECYQKMTVDGQTYEDTFAPEETDIPIFWVFNADGTCYQVDDLNDESRIPVDMEQLRYKVEDNKLHAIDGYSDMIYATWTIDKLNDNDMVLLQDLSEGGNIANIKITFKRLK